MLRGMVLKMYVVPPISKKLNFLFIFKPREILKLEIKYTLLWFLIDKKKGPSVGLINAMCVLAIKKLKKAIR